jgi:hypothetical protein
VKPRLPQSVVLHHDAYDPAPETRDRPAYDVEMSKFSNPPRAAGRDLDPRVLNRMGPLKSMNGRERMRAALARLGFEIR